MSVEWNGSSLDLLGELKKKPPPPFHDQYTKEEVEEAIQANGGWLSVTAKALHIPLRTLEYIICEKYPSLQDTVMECTEMYNDLAESQVVKSIKRGELDACKYWLNNKGKGRGWNKKTDVAGDIDAPIIFNIVPATPAAQAQLQKPKEIEVKEVGKKSLSERLEEGMNKEKVR